MPRNDFDGLLQEAIDEGLSSLGESAKRAVYFHLNRIFGIRRDEVSDNVKAFAEALETIFGPGADFLEILIMKRLYEKTGRNLKEEHLENLRFTEYVAASKRAFAKTVQPYRSETPSKGKATIEISADTCIVRPSRQATDKARRRRLRSRAQQETHRNT